MNKKTIGWLVVIAVLVGGYFLIRQMSGPAEPGKYDEFAKCLSGKGATMYGAYWCTHCQNEKAAFGSSFEFVNYVECTQDPRRCTAEKIAGYPTWIFPDGRRFEGEQGLLKLSEASGCALPESGQ